MALLYGFFFFCCCCCYCCSIAITFVGHVFLALLNLTRNGNKKTIKKSYCKIYFISTFSLFHICTFFLPPIPSAWRYSFRFVNDELYDLTRFNDWKTVDYWKYILKFCLKTKRKSWKRWKSSSKRWVCIGLMNIKNERKTKWS